jgi:AraC-like DNA-binding protein
MAPYREFAPPPHLADSVECFWTMQSEQSFRHRVLPDGCADILFTRDTKAALTVVGAMTVYEDFQIPTGQLLVGVRFRPGMSGTELGVPVDEITDARPLLEELWGARARTLLEQMAHAKSPQQAVSLLGQSLRTPKPRTPVQRALAWMELNPISISLDDVAFQASMSIRQFRRICIQRTGVSPNLLGRILRFRKALSQVREHADLAADCGYFDQSHFIAEFQRFAGQTPAAYLRATL